MRGFQPFWRCDRIDAIAGARSRPVAPISHHARNFRNRNQSPPEELTGGHPPAFIFIDFYLTHRRFVLICLLRAVSVLAFRGVSRNPAVGGKDADPVGLQADDDLFSLTASVATDAKWGLFNNRSAARQTDDGLSTGDRLQGERLPHREESLYWRLAVASFFGNGVFLDPDAPWLPGSPWRAICVTSPTPMTSAIPNQRFTATASPPIPPLLCRLPMKVAFAASCPSCRYHPIRKNTHPNRSK